MISGVVTGGSRGKSAPLTAKNLPKIGEKKAKEKIGKRGGGESGRKGKGLLLCSSPPPTPIDWAGYATAHDSR